MKQEDGLHELPLDINYTRLLLLYYDTEEHLVCSLSHLFIFSPKNTTHSIVVYRHSLTLCACGFLQVSLYLPALGSLAQCPLAAHPGTGPSFHSCNVQGISCRSM